MIEQELTMISVVSKMEIERHMAEARAQYDAASPEERAEMMKEVEEVRAALKRIGLYPPPESV